ncbi:hypothetical protein BDZ89DRAFT_911387, partial [Hymenopellis radicata]
EGFIDVLPELTDEEREQLAKDVKPIRLALVKLRALAFKIINSSTILLPAWKRLLREHKLVERLIPRDVKTRWNSTFDLIVFGLKYRPYIDEFTA